MIRRLSPARVAIRDKCLAVLAAWIPRRGKTLRQLCEEHGVSYSRYCHMTHAKGYGAAPKLQAQRVKRWAKTR